MYVLTKQDAQASWSIITSILSLFSHDALILIDPGSTHSFITCNFMRHIDSLPKLLNYELTISTLLGKTMLVEWVCRSCVLKMGERVLSMDLILHDIEDLDVILGIDWLVAYHASIH